MPCLCNRHKDHAPMSLYVTSGSLPSSYSTICSGSLAAWKPPKSG